MYYRALNYLVHPVAKVHPKAKGALALVPLLNIDEINTWLCGSKFYFTLHLRDSYY